MANHAAQVISRLGVQPAYAAAAAGDTIDTGESTVLFVKNAAVGAVDVTIAAQGGRGGLELEDLVVTVPAGQTLAIGPIVPGLFADPATGKAGVTYSALPSVTVACLSL